MAHTPASGTTRRTMLMSRFAKFQSTPPRAGDLAPMLDRWSGQVSIHAPTRGATVLPRESKGLNGVSIHAPTRGATRAIKRGTRRGLRFQSTPPRGGRPTQRRRSSRLAVRFNPRPHAGGDHPGRRRHSRGFYFNPRPHAGGDVVPIPLFTLLGVSIHAPTRGATPKAGAPLAPSPCFNPRPHAGGDTEFAQVAAENPPGFNPRPHAGGDGGDALDHLGVMAVSIHAPTRGATCSGIP